MTGVRPFDLPGISGVLRVSRFRSGSVPSGDEGRFVSVLVNGPDYRGLSDNDLRGHLDGTFVRGWNQATQVHVRLGRAGSPDPPRYGQGELFRILHRWDGIRLPEESRILSCRLELAVEKPPPTDVRIYLYSVLRSWGAGSGGIHGNNLSPPRHGEAWWLEARHEVERWGLPGAGLASNTDPAADTPASPLAQAVCRPDSRSLILESSLLADYVSARIAGELPLQFLLKASDLHEDVPGAFLSLYSAEYGDSQNTERRPRLVLEWTSPLECLEFEESVTLEHGRERIFQPFPVASGDRIVCGFRSEPDFETPTTEVRVGTATQSGQWKPIGMGMETGEGWAQIRVRSLNNPIELGRTFSAEIRDTWVVSAPAEHQLVRWQFLSPTGVLHDSKGTYEGGFRWSVDFLPDEPGPWRYSWTHSFDGTAVQGAPGQFDVVAGSDDVIRSHVEALSSIAASAGSQPSSAEVRRLRSVLSRLERAAMTGKSPEHDWNDRRELAQAFNRARSALWKRPVPDVPPLEAHRLVHRVAGMRLQDPIPYDPSRYQGPPPSGTGSARPRYGSRFRAILQRVRRALGSQQPPTTQ